MQLRPFLAAICVVFIGLLISACGRHEAAPTAGTDEKVTGENVTDEKSDFAIEKALSESERLNQWLDEKYTEYLQFSPITMTFQGRKERYDAIDDMSEAGQRKQLEWRAKSVQELKGAFDYEALTADAKISYDMWMFEYQQAKEEMEFAGQEYMFHQMNGQQAFLPQFLISFHKVEELSDMEAYINRIKEMGRAIQQLVERAKAYAENGVRPPQFAYERVIVQAQAVISGAPFENADHAENSKDSPLLADAKRKIDALLEKEVVDETQAKQLSDKTSQTLKEHLLPAYQTLIDWVREDMQVAEGDTSGVGQREGGMAYYNARLRNFTTTDLTADEVHNIGLEDVARLTAEMEALKEKVGFKGSLQEFFTFVKTDERFFYPNTDEGRENYLKDVEAFLAHIDSQLPNYFSVLPKAELLVKRVESFREQAGGSPHYFPPAADGSRPGVYYSHLIDMSTMPKNEMEAIAYHEGKPGHHMQISIAQELEAVPEFRKQARIIAYIEGWALYSELLAKEMGGYQDDYSDFGRMITEIWRAIRLVLDTGLHAKGWTEQQAIDYFLEHSPLAKATATAEVRRYMVIPGQATSYKIGMIKILELRSLAEQELGEGFSIREFHDLVLGGGATPLDILERRVKQWIEREKAS